MYTIYIKSTVYKLYEYTNIVFMEVIYKLDGLGV